MLWNDDGFVALDVSTDLFGAALDDEATETAYVDVFASSEAPFDFFEELFERHEDIHFGNPSLFRYGGNEICFAHANVLDLSE